MFSCKQFAFPSARRLVFDNESSKVPEPVKRGSAYDLLKTILRTMETERASSSSARTRHYGPPGARPGRAERFRGPKRFVPQPDGVLCRVDESRRDQVQIQPEEEMAQWKSEVNTPMRGRARRHSEPRG
jgi:hypothetical protein